MHDMNVYINSFAYFITFSKSPLFLYPLVMLTLCHHILKITYCSFVPSKHMNCGLLGVHIIIILFELYILNSIMLMHLLYKIRLRLEHVDLTL